MATVNFSVPDEVKEAFNRAFASENKSAVIARLMREAVDEVERQRQRQVAFRRLTERRKRRPSMTGDEIRKAREAGRP
jgi:hypothetical protein